MYAAALALVCGLEPNSLFHRNDDDNCAWWVSGMRKAFYFFVFTRNSVNTAIQISKLAGYLAAPHV